MADTVYLDKRAFKKGVRDIMTLRPIRDAVSAAVTGAKSSSDRFAKTRNNEEHGRHERRNTPTRKAR